MSVSFKKRHRNLIIWILAINALIFFVLLTYAQDETNSHNRIGPAFGNFFYILAALLFVIGTLRSIEEESDVLWFMLWLVLSFSLVLWGPVFHHLYCQGCAASG